MNPNITNHKKWVLPIIVIAQFCCTSLWFASNGIMMQLSSHFKLNDHALEHLTSMVQFGFIIGTLVFAILTIADRFSPSKIFFICATLGAIFNLGMIYHENTLVSLLFFRFLTGFCLAGIYPIGMKIAADHFNQGLGKSLGFLVGALVLGTSISHLLKSFPTHFSWKVVIITPSILAFLGGCLILITIANGPYRKPGTGFRFRAFLNVFKNRDFRSAAFGYFGHMWELYAFWAFVPMIISTYNHIHHKNLNTALLSFSIIGIGSLSCIISGYLSTYFGAKKTAFTCLLCSCLCCIIAPFMFWVDSEELFITYLFFWGMVIIADSPLFSTLVAKTAAIEIKGTALTIVNCIGYAISIISIQLLGIFDSNIKSYLILSIGPILGLIALRKRD